MRIKSSKKHFKLFKQYHINAFIVTFTIIHKPIHPPIFPSTSGVKEKFLCCLKVHALSSKPKVLIKGTEADIGLLQHPRWSSPRSASEVSATWHAAYTSCDDASLSWLV